MDSFNVVFRTSTFLYMISVKPEHVLKLGGDNCVVVAGEN